MYPFRIWRLLAIEIGLAVLSEVLSRSISFVDSLLGDKFTNVVSLKLMDHAAKLDLVSFEDPVFYDKLERARRQTTSRLGMLAGLAGMCQQLITLVSLSVSVVWFSPWYLVLLVAAMVPPFLGETRFAMLAYSLLYRSTPERRELDYLRWLGASNTSAKEVKIFGLGELPHRTSPPPLRPVLRRKQEAGASPGSYRNTFEFAPNRRILRNLRSDPYTPRSTAG